MPDHVPAKRQRRIWHYGKARGKTGDLDWFNSRLAEPDSVVRELAAIFYPAFNHSMRWWTNGFTHGWCDAGKSGYTSRPDSAAKCNDTALRMLQRHIDCAPPLTKVSDDTATHTSVQLTVPLGECLGIASLVWICGMRALRRET